MFQILTQFKFVKIRQGYEFHCQRVKSESQHATKRSVCRNWESVSRREQIQCALTKAYEEVFGQRLRRLQEWTAQQDIPAILHQKLRD